MKNKHFLKLCLVAVAVSIFGYQLRAYPEFMRIYAADPQAKAEMRRDCGVCHVNSAGGGARNAFGQAFQANGLKITDELRAKFPDVFNSSASAQSNDLPITFVKDSDSQAIVELNGKKYIVDTKTRTIKEFQAEKNVAVVTPIEKNKVAAPAQEEEKAYQQMDVRLVNLPTAKPIAKGALVGEFTHRFPLGEFDPVDGTGLFGLDGYAIPSFGFIYGLTDRISVGGYRSSGVVGRPIQFFVGAGLTDEHKGHWVTTQARVALEGRDNFQRNFTTSLELTVARSITNKAQLYFVPTLSINNRPFGAVRRNLAGANTFALGIGGALNIRPTVALMGEANWRVNEAGRFGNTAPVMGFGIEKVTISRRHAFSLVFTNGTGTTFGQRSGTKAALIGADDGFRSLAIGFNISRRIF